MEENMKYPEKMIFGLDIGTRSLVGSVGYMDRGRFNVVAHAVKEHETRAMLDGQIHDIKVVGESIAEVRRKLEEDLGRKLEDVCIAAAGRVLKTVTVSVSADRSDDTAVTEEEIYSLDLLGVEKAYEIMRNDYPDTQFYCVGYTVVKYYMNDYIIHNLEGHRAKKIGANVLATFLPHEVVDSLYAAVEVGGLQVANLTLEPIAAINVAIPEQFRLLNIALVDVGAGTSDICITKDGSITAYGMIPCAGDKITEIIVRECLVDFQTAEKIKIESTAKKTITYKDILGISHKITSEEVYAMYKDTVEDLAKQVSEKIKELNADKSVSAVFVVGGGGKVEGFTDFLAKELDILSERVALRGEEVLTDVNFLMGGVKKDPLLVTPIGICVNYYAQKNNFVIISVNDKRVKLYDNDRLSVIDAVIQAGITNMDLFPKRGKELIFKLNGNEKTYRGELGNPAVITVNDKEANLNTKVEKSDRVYISPSTAGKAASVRIDGLSEYNSKLVFNINGKNVEYKRAATVNGELVTGSYEICDGDDVSIPEFYTLEQLVKFMDIDADANEIWVNGHQGILTEPIYNDFKVIIEEKNKDYMADTYNSYPEDDTDYEINETNEADDINDTLSNEQDENPQKNTETVKIESGIGGMQGFAGHMPSKDYITVTVNNTPVILKNKKSYIFVDILDVYPFDTSKALGTELVLKKNGYNTNFSSDISDGDTIELYWR